MCLKVLKRVNYFSVAADCRFPQVAIIRIRPSARDTAGIEITTIVSTPSRRIINTDT